MKHYESPSAMVVRVFYEWNTILCSSSFEEYEDNSLEDFYDSDNWDEFYW